ncbi:MAG: hypothetical protein HUK03_09835 [Bacteroidaceae bacterium]|nr:hypothetical protein [Bacteroidaceae bacterium]
MRKVLYIHGFASAGSSGTATTLRQMLYPKGVSVLSPDVPVQPLEAMAFLQDFVERDKPELIVATSMGAMYAEQLTGIPRILVNPSFHMARLLTFRGLGKREFRNKREDGVKDFKVDKAMIDAYKEVEKQSFQCVTAEEKTIVWGLFGTKDKLVNCQADYTKHYGREHFRTFEGEHFLNDKVLSREVFPLVAELLKV